MPAWICATQSATGSPAASGGSGSCGLKITGDHPDGPLATGRERGRKTTRDFWTRWGKFSLPFLPFGAGLPGSAVVPVILERTLLRRSGPFLLWLRLRRRGFLLDRRQED